jgi:hypothetical protein
MCEGRNYTGASPWESHEDYDPIFFLNIIYVTLTYMHTRILANNVHIAIENGVLKAMLS